MSTLVPVGVADAHVHRLYGEYAGLPVGVVTQCVQHAAALQQLIWNACPEGTWAGKACAFHEGHEEAVFGLMQRTVSRAQRRVEHDQSGLTGQLAEAGDDVLDFGGGLGFSASLLRDAGKNVTYVDVDGPVTAFARWYFERCGQDDVEVGTTPSATAELPKGRQWDLVLAECVLECVPDPVATVERLARAVRGGGTLFVVLDGGVEAAGATMRAVDVAALLAGSPTLRGMRHVLSGEDGRHAFRAD
ncbi:MAG: class I SAM-dependent methyltransferase [Planctomycetes bacterium]|nr:class I SAM-dependent methyltransferase [Planctomycetota bacterium]